MQCSLSKSNYVGVVVVLVRKLSGSHFGTKRRFGATWRPMIEYMIVLLFWCPIPPGST